MEGLEDRSSKMIRDCIQFQEYIPGKSIDEVKKKYGLKRVVKLASNENPYGASPKAIEILKNFKDLHLYPDPSYEELKQRISEYTGWEFERIVIGAGSDGILETLFRILIERGDEVVIPIPTFPYYHTLTRISCGREVLVKRGRDFRIESDITNAITEKTKLILICNPNNPTGNDEREETIREIVESTKAIVFIDEAYIEFADSRFDIDEENVIIARTFSKAFGLANLRIGYARLPSWLIKYYKAASTPFPISTIAEKVAIASLEDINWMKSCVKKIKSERERLYKEMSKIVKVYPSQANFLFFETGIDSSLVTEELMKRGVIVRDCKNFIGCKNNIRVSVGKPEDNDLFLECLRDVYDSIDGNSGMW